MLDGPSVLPPLVHERRIFDREDAHHAALEAARDHALAGVVGQAGRAVACKHTAVHFHNFEFSFEHLYRICRTED